MGGQVGKAKAAGLHRLYAARVWPCRAGRSLRELVPPYDGMLRLFGRPYLSRAVARPLTRSEFKNWRGGFSIRVVDHPHGQAQEIGAAAEEHLMPRASPCASNPSNIKTCIP